MLRKHDWEYHMELGRYPVFYCRACSVHKKEHQSGTTTYDLPGPDFTYEQRVTEEPCCWPAFDPHIPLEELAKAGFVPVAMTSGPVPADLTHAATVRRIVKHAIERGLAASEANIILLEEELLAACLGHRWPGT